MKQPWAWYNEIDKFAAAWLRELIKAGLIADGEVDERSIVDVRPDDLRGFTQCHFFAGIGVWSYALRAAGWSDDTPVWTGSCPCQSFSTSGKRGGFSDQRHLWPAWFRLIRECRPNVCFGEQVASKDGLAWLDVVSSDMEGEGYAFGACDTCAAGFGAPMLSQRLYFVAEAKRGGRQDRQAIRRVNVATDSTTKLPEFASEDSKNGDVAEANRSGAREAIRDYREAGEETHGSSRANNCSFVSMRGRSVGGMDASETTERRRTRGADNRGRRTAEVRGSSPAGELGASDNAGLEGRSLQPGERGSELLAGKTGFVNGFWGNAEWIWCRDEKFRPVEPGTFPLVDGTPARVGRLRGYGNAIVAEQAKAFIESYMEIQ